MNRQTPHSMLHVSRFSGRRTGGPSYLRAITLFAIIILIGMLATTTTHAQVRSDVDGNAQPNHKPQATIDPQTLAQHIHDSDDTQAVPTDAQHQAFAAQLNLDDLRKLAVFDQGRVKIIDTLAREQINRIYGKPAWKNQLLENPVRYDPVFTLFDLVFNKSFYFDKPTIHVEVLPLRRELLADLPPEQQEQWLKWGRLAPAILAQPHAQQVLRAADSNLSMLNGRNKLLNAAMAFDDNGLGLQFVSPPAGSHDWATMTDISPHPAHHGHGHSDEMHPPHVTTADPALAQAVTQQYDQLVTAWHNLDAPKTNAAIAALVDALPKLNPETYLPEWKRSAELTYNKTNRLTIGYIGYFLGLICLLVAANSSRKSLFTVGVVFVAVGLLVQTAGMFVRWSLAERNWIPLHNQYESFIAISWFAVVIGIVVMLVRRQAIFGAAAAAVGTVTQLLANRIDIPSSEITQVAGILATSNILKIHVTMVLSSYSLIFLAFVVSLAYLANHYFRARPASDSATTTPASSNTATLIDLDRAQMVMMQLAFWILGVGILLGAYWADHAWGRWWAWDPKETWALITWIIYLMVIHLRFTVKNRGLVTAWMSVVGFIVMLWTYWGVNLLLAGLHSYA